MAGFPNLWSRPVRSPRPRRARLRLETCEDRTVPAVVTATVNGSGLLTLTAVDAASGETLTLTPTATPGMVHVAGAGGTTIKVGNAAASADVDIKNVKSVSINLKGGDDSATLQGVKLAGSASFAGVTGAKTFSLTPGTFIGQNVNVTTTTGSDALTITGALIGKNLTVDLGGGDSDNTLTVSNTFVGGAAKVTAGALNDSPTLTSVTVGGSLQLSVPNVQSSFSLTSVGVGGSLTAKVGGAGGGTGGTSKMTGVAVGGKLQVTGGNEDDVIQANDLVVGDDAKFDLGNGFNKVLIDTTGNGTSNVGSLLLGGLEVTAGNKRDEVSLGSQKPVVVAGPTSMSLGSETAREGIPGGDFVQIDDTIFLDEVKIDFGGGRGTDSLAIEQNQTAASLQTTFAAALHVTMGADDDTVDLGAEGGGPARQVLFAMPGGPQGTFIDGGLGSDTLNRNNGDIDGTSIRDVNGLSYSFWKNFEVVVPPVA